MKWGKAVLGGRVYAEVFASNWSLRRVPGAAPGGLLWYSVEILEATEPFAKFDLSKLSAIAILLAREALMLA